MREKEEWWKVDGRYYKDVGDAQEAEIRAAIEAIKIQMASYLLSRHHTPTKDRWWETLRGSLAALKKIEEEYYE